MQTDTLKIAFSWIFGNFRKIFDLFDFNFPGSSFSVLSVIFGSLCLALIIMIILNSHFDFGRLADYKYSYIPKHGGVKYENHYVPKHRKW